MDNRKRKPLKWSYRSLYKENFEYLKKTIIKPILNVGKTVCMRLIRFYQKTPWYKQAVMLCGFMKDKDYPQMLKTFSKHFENLYITSVRSPRAATLQEIKKLDFFKQNTVCFPLAFHAFQEACRHSRIVFVSGSFYLVASLRTRVGARKD